MTVCFADSKDGNKTVSIQNQFIHSTYSPIKEAERFVQNINVSFELEALIILEPGLSYILPFLKKRFPNSKLICIRFCNSFFAYNEGWDFVINYEENENNLENLLFNYLGEEKLLSTLLLEWNSINKIFGEQINNCWKIFKNILEKSKTLLITRQVFEKKWLINTCNFIKYAKNIYSTNLNPKLPVLIIASGPSLKNILEFIKTNQNNFFIIALSSAINVLLKNQIIPDLCFSTDGGFWAGEHLKPLQIYKEKINLAISVEGFCSKKILKSQKIIPLIYSDGICTKLLNHINYPVVLAKRNGTVSGTALEFAEEHFSSSIYFAGLDLQSTKGFQHIQPNILEINNSLFDNRIKPKELRIAKSEHSSQALEIYRQWFNSYKCKNKIFRIMDSKENKSLGEITDITSNEFMKIDFLPIQKETQFTLINEKQSNNLCKAKEFLLNELEKSEVQKQLFPMDFVLLNHAVTSEEKTEVYKKINDKLKNLTYKMEKIFNE
ncbi:MAG: DUF115 domain-containing protein [Treponema bryantii]|nr:DUF115 domain-containing protein [Treponema bryantii]